MWENGLIEIQRMSLLYIVKEEKVINKFILVFSAMIIFQWLGTLNCVLYYYMYFPLKEFKKYPAS